MHEQIFTGSIHDHPLSKSIFFETEEGDGQSKFFLSEGVWYEVSPSLIEQLHLRLTNYFFPNNYPEYTHNLTCEADYNEILAKHLPQAALMDKKDILPWTTSKIEPCDVAYLDGETLALLHVKRKTSSEDLSHLLSQGVNSWRAINSNAEVREKFLEHCGKGGLDVERVKEAITRRRIKIGYVITTHKPLDAAENNLPIFTRISADRIISEAADLGIDVSFTYVRESPGLGNDPVVEQYDNFDGVVED